MILRSFVCVAHRRLRQFAADQDGVSAIEFAMLLPLMLTLYLGGVEVSQAVSADRKTTIAALTLGDLTAQASCVTNSDVNKIFLITNQVLYPFYSSDLASTITRVDVDQNGIATVAKTAQGTDWSITYNGGVARTGNVTTYIPSGLLVASTSIIWAEATYMFKPTIGYVLTGTLTLKEQSFLRGRVSSSVAYTTSSCS